MQECGHTFTLTRGESQFHGALALISADNPASNGLGGFKEGFTAHRHCRQCKGKAVKVAQEVCKICHV